MEPPVLLVLSLGTLGIITALSEDPQLLFPPFSELGIPFNVSCAVSSGSAANFTVTADNRSFPVTLSPDGRRATAAVTVNRTGSVQLCCTVGVGGVERRRSKDMTIYNILVPELNVSNERPSAGSELRILCSLPPGSPPDAQVLIRSGNEKLRDWKSWPAEATLTPSREKAELELSCEVELGSIHRKIFRRIEVLADPRLDPSACPSHQNWTEGSAGVLLCRASGRPEPQVLCSKDGNSIPAGIPQPALRHHAGVYRCRATNELGTAESNVTVWVQLRPVPAAPAAPGAPSAGPGPAGRGHLPLPPPPGHQNRTLLALEAPTAAGTAATAATALGSGHSRSIHGAVTGTTGTPGAVTGTTGGSTVPEPGPLGPPEDPRCRNRDHRDPPVPEPGPPVHPRCRNRDHRDPLVP